MSSRQPPLYHAAEPVEWQRALHTGWYDVSTRGRTFAEEGYIHASYEHQIERVVNAIYPDLGELVLLLVDRDGLESLDVPVIDESPTGDPGDERFPHLYGRLPLAAVLDARPWRRQRDRPWRVADIGGARPLPESRPDR